MVVTYDADFSFYTLVHSREGGTNGWDAMDCYMWLDSQAKVVHPFARGNLNQIKVFTNGIERPAYAT